MKARVRDRVRARARARFGVRVRVGARVRVRVGAVLMRVGSSWIVSGGSFSRSETTSLSWRIFLVWNGPASKLSKFGSPAPGTTIEQKPWERLASHGK